MDKDGFFDFITNVKNLSAAEIVTQYKQLWRIEDVFGEIKGTLSARPIFHWTDSRIIGHLVVFFLCYYCEAILTRLLRSSEEKLNSKAIEKR